jgi:hypothetical protein
MYFNLLVLAMFIKLTGSAAAKLNCTVRYDSSKEPNGFITSPNYPNDYPNDVLCVYDFQGDQNERVILSIDELHLEPAQTISVLQINSGKRTDLTEAGNTLLKDKYSEVADVHQCFYDYLEIYSFDVLGFYRLRSRHCGQHANLQIVSTSPTFRVIFGSDRNLAFKGFKIRYHFSYLNILPFVTQKACGNSHIEGKYLNPMIGIERTTHNFRLVFRRRRLFE